jgi:hypothetical protein
MDHSGKLAFVLWVVGVKPLRDKLRMRLAFGEEMRFPIPQG